MHRDYICFDFETGGRDAHTCQPTQLAALALDGRNFRVKGEFNSEIWAETDDDKAIKAGLGPIEEGALKVTGKTREQISKAPKLKPVWKKFVNFVNKYNWKKTPFFAPVPAGFNILGYDMHIIRRICKELGPWDEKRQDQQLFSQIYKVDMMDNYYMWTEGDPTVKSRSMDAIRKRLGMSEENAHDALQDVKDTANIMIKFMKTHRAVYKNLKLDKAFADGELYV
jgi:DNA polymerase III epsilon subunit-like protein